MGKGGKLKTVQGAWAGKGGASALGKSKMPKYHREGEQGVTEKKKRSPLGNKQARMRIAKEQRWSRCAATEHHSDDRETSPLAVGKPGNRGSDDGFTKS